MREEQNILHVAALQPDYLGFIFYEKSPRYVGVDFKIPRNIPASIKRVGVFVDADTRDMLSAASRHALGYVQLHGNESVEQCRELRDHNLKIIKVFNVDDETDFSLTIPYTEVVDFFLFDTKGKYHGGNARTFDWSLLKKYSHQVPFFLSGGLNAENISGIRELDGMNLHALDMNSGVEIEPALKDPERIKALKRTLDETF